MTPRTEALRLKLINSSEEYNLKASSLLDLNKRQESYQKNMKRQEMAILSDVLSIQLDGKPKYTNQSQRDIALQRNLDSNQQFRDYKQNYDELTHKIKQITSELDILRFQQRNNLKLCDIEIEFKPEVVK